MRQPIDRAFYMAQYFRRMKWRLQASDLIIAAQDTLIDFARHRTNGRLTAEEREAFDQLERVANYLLKQTIDELARDKFLGEYD
jgi:hypothetical protein